MNKIAVFLISLILVQHPYIKTLGQNKAVAPKIAPKFKEKPSKADVILMVMQNCNVIFPKIDRDCPMIGQSKIKTVGEFLSKYWEKHTITDTAQHNYVDIGIVEGNNPAILEKHWEITFTLLWSVGNAETSSVGIIFYILTKDWQVVKDSFQCYEDS